MSQARSPLLVLPSRCSGLAQGSALPQPTHSTSSPDVDVAGLIAAAELALKEPLRSVMDKPAAPVSGDKHDYWSLAIYWWPDPTKADGLPYVNRDGQVNPEVKQYDRPTAEKATNAITCLVQAAGVSGRRDFLDRAGQQMATWFLDPATRMNPHLRYAQFIPGICEGRCYGIIEWSMLLPWMLEAWAPVSHLAFTERQNAALDAWLGLFLDWLLESDHGRDEARRVNNHAVYYDLLVVYLMLWLGRKDEARALLREVPANRIVTQIEPDGSMPHELARTLSYSYTAMNIEGFMHLAMLGRHVDVDLWHWQSADGRGLRQALRYLFDLVCGGQPWPFAQIKPADYGMAQRLIRQAGVVYGPPFDADALVTTEPRTQ